MKVVQMQSCFNTFLVHDLKEKNNFISYAVESEFVLDLVSLQIK